MHCALTYSSRMLHCTDLGSVNGSWLDGTRLTANQQTRLPEGATLVLGRSVAAELAFTVVAASAAVESDAIEPIPPMLDDLSGAAATGAAAEAEQQGCTETSRMHRAHSRIGSLVARERETAAQAEEDAGEPEEEDADVEEEDEAEEADVEEQAAEADVEEQAAEEQEADILQDVTDGAAAECAAQLQACSGANSWRSRKRSAAVAQSDAADSEAQRPLTRKRR